MDKNEHKQRQTGARQGQQMDKTNQKGFAVHKWNSAFMHNNVHHNKNRK